MTPGQAKEIKVFSINWIRKVVSKKKKYQQKLIEVVEDLFPDNIGEWDTWGMLGCRDWDYGEEYTERGKTHWHCSLSNRLREIIEIEDDFFLTEKAKNDIMCTIRIATDLLVNPSGGVVGYTVGDIKKAYDGNIPETICTRYERDLNAANEDDGIWL